MKTRFRGLLPKALALGLLALICTHQRVMAHAPVVFRPVFRTNLAAQSHLLRTIRYLPLSGASKGFAASIKATSSAGFTNAIQNAPLANVSGQFTGVSYLSTTSGFGGPFTTEGPNVVPFGSNPLNNGFDTFISGSPTNLSFFGNSLMLGAYKGLAGTAHFSRLLPSTLFTHLSGAERSVQATYKQAASAGYNAGVQVLEHPTGGLLFGTTYYQNAVFGATDFNIYPGFEAFGNNPFASASVGQFYASNPLNLSQPLVSYIQFGKYTRYIHNGLLYGTFYFPQTTNPPFGAGAPNPYLGSGFFGVSIGSNIFNTGIQSYHTPFPQIFGSSSYFF